MLTPKHRALFNAAYSTPLLRSAEEEAPSPKDAEKPAADSRTEAPAEEGTREDPDTSDAHHPRPAA